jgi:hypothetical protein
MNPLKIEQLKQRVLIGAKLLQEHGELGAPKLRLLTGFSETSANNVLRRLVEQGEAHAVRVGNRLIYKSGPAPHVEVARFNPMDPERGPYRGVDWSRSTSRPGCLDAMRLPSRVSDRLIPHRPPIYGCLPSGDRT